LAYNRVLDQIFSSVWWPTNPIFNTLNSHYIQEQQEDLVFFQQEYHKYNCKIKIKDERSWYSIL
jgi:hypothetical protein